MNDNYLTMHKRIKGLIMKNIMKNIIDEITKLQSFIYFFRIAKHFLRFTAYNEFIAAFN